MSYVDVLIGISVLVIAAFSFFFIRSKMVLRRDHEKKLGRQLTRKLDTIKGEEARDLMRNKKNEVKY